MGVKINSNNKITYNLYKNQNEILLQRLPSQNNLKLNVLKLIKKSKQEKKWLLLFPTSPRANNKAWSWWWWSATTTCLKIDDDITTKYNYLKRPGKSCQNPINDPKFLKVFAKKHFFLSNSEM